MAAKGYFRRVNLLTSMLLVFPLFLVYQVGVLALPQVGLFGKIVLSFGAGVHEELVFRLILVSAFTALGTRVLGLRRVAAVALSFFISSILFSAAHHVLGGEPWRVGVFVYRLLCG